MSGISHYYIATVAVVLCIASASNGGFVSGLSIRGFGDCKVAVHRLQSSKIYMSPPTALDDEKTTTDDINEPAEKKTAINSIKQYFSSSVRSTTQTDAIGQKQPAVQEEEEVEGGGMNIPQEVLQPFSLLLLSQFILFLGVGAVIPTIPLYGQSIGLSGSSNGIVISAPAVALLLVSRIAGEYADRGRKGAMIGGMAVIAISDVGTAASNSLATLVLARLGLGLGRGFAEAGERGMLTDLANKTPRLRGRALALQQASVALGIAFGAPLGGLLVEEYGARAAFLCVSAAAVVALAIYAILPETVLAGDDSSESEQNVIAQTKSDESKSNNGADWAQLLKTSSTWRSLAIAQSGISFGFACKIAVIPILANEYLGGATSAGLLLSAAGVAGLVGAPLGGLLADMAGSRVAAAVSGTISGLSLALVPVGLSIKSMDSTMIMDSSETSPIAEGMSSSSSFWESILTGIGGPEATAFTLLVICWSIGAAAQGPALTALAQEKAPAGFEATALGLPRAAGDGTYIVAPLILGYFTDQFSTVPGISCTIAGGAICLGSIALLLVTSTDNVNKTE